MIEVAVSINGTSLFRVEVVNRGPLGGKYVGDDWEGGGGPRVYRWTTGSLTGEVLHQRSDGAVPLAAAVLLALDSAIRRIEVDG